MKKKLIEIEDLIRILDKEKKPTLMSASIKLPETKERLDPEDGG
jgi:hypothetical protein